MRSRAARAANGDARAFDPILELVPDLRGMDHVGALLCLAQMINLYRGHFIQTEQLPPRASRNRV